MRTGSYPLDSIEYEKNYSVIVKVGLAAVTAAVVWVIAAARGQDPTLAGPAVDSHRNKKRQFR